MLGRLGLVRKGWFSRLRARLVWALAVTFYIYLDDHIIALKEDGLVYAMGEDSFGQCGQDDKNRNTHPPFT